MIRLFKISNSVDGPSSIARDNNVEGIELDDRI
jgi:hypothetical protein